MAFKLLSKKKQGLGCSALLPGWVVLAQKGYLLQAGLLLNKWNPAFFPMRAFSPLNTPGGDRLDFSRRRLLTMINPDGRLPVPGPLLPGAWVPIGHCAGVTTSPPCKKSVTRRDIHFPQILPGHLTVAGGPLLRLPETGAMQGLP